MTQKYRAEIGPVTRDDLTRVTSDLNTTQVVESVELHRGRLYVSFWAEGRPEADASLNRSTRGVVADYRIL